MVVTGTKPDSAPQKPVNVITSYSIHYTKLYEIFGERRFDPDEIPMVEKLMENDTKKATKIRKSPVKKKKHEGGE